jgi:hypothetical protein
VSNPDLHQLPRLDRSFYQAFAAVHWTMRVEPVVTSWLTERFHGDFRTVLLHACARERLMCPAYCLMPDHLHLMCLGLALASDQLNGTRFLRTCINRLLEGRKLENRGSDAGLQEPGEGSHPSLNPRIKWQLQPQAHDHVLRTEERKLNAFAKVCFYILANPVRAELVRREVDWPFSGSVAPGYPDLYPFQEGYWELFWKIYFRHREVAPRDPLK